MKHKTANGHTIIAMLEQFAPKHLAYEGDPIGLQIGNLNLPVRKVMVALDVLEAVVDEAIEQQANLIIAHHPFLYRPLKKIDTSTSKGRIIKKLIKNDIAVYAAHTNLDVAKGGVNDWLADALKLENTEVLSETTAEDLFKLAVYVPVSYAESVKQAISNAGAGHIGNYSHCFFKTNGEGQFLPLHGSDPFVGKKGQVEKVEEVKLETIMPASAYKKVVAALIQAHPYEEPAFDVYPLVQKGEGFGIGKIGNLQQPLSLDEFVFHVKNSLGLKAVRVVKGHSRNISKVAVVGGDGNKFIFPALYKGADVLVSGDIYYHNAHDGQAEGLTIVDAGHHIEQIMKKQLEEILSHKLLEQNYQTEVISSNVHTDPFQFM